MTSPMTIDSKYLEEIELLLSNLLENQKYASIELNKPISLELFNFIYKRDLLNRITSQSLTVYLQE